MRLVDSSVGTGIASGKRVMLYFLHDRMIDRSVQNASREQLRRQVFVRIGSRVDVANLTSYYRTPNPP